MCKTAFRRTMFRQLSRPRGHCSPASHDTHRVAGLGAVDPLQRLASGGPYVNPPKPRPHDHTQPPALGLLRREAPRATTRASRAPEDTRYLCTQGHVPL